MTKGFLIMLGATLLGVLGSGCSPMRYSEYTGKNTIWQTSGGTMSETSYAIPVYRGWPERPYKVLGSVRFEDARKYWDDGIIRMAASAGKRNGGDAVIIRRGAEFGVSKITGALNAPMTLWQDQPTTALVIRWLTPEEFREQEEQKERFLKQYRAEHPNVKVNEEVEDIVLQYLMREGAAPSYAKETAHRFSQALEMISKRTDGDLSGGWVYKGSITTTSMASQSDEESFLGLATVKVDGENIAIVSNTGRIEVNFTGSLIKGRVQGQIGIGSFTSKCEGAALDNKISISFQSLTPDGTVRGNLTFQR